MAQVGDPLQMLAARLRQLRTETWRDTVVTQKHLAAAFGVSVPLISSWESAKDPKPPPIDRLGAYARFFATPRSVNGRRANLVEQLTPAEERLRDELEQELLRLRADVGGSSVADARQAALVTEPPYAGPWHFDDRAPITIVCGSLPSHLRADEAYTNPNSPDYIELYSYADLDALVELQGHVRAANPRSRVTFASAASVKPDDLTSHLALLGGVDWNKYVRNVLEALKVPVMQQGRDEVHDEGAFVVNDGGAGSVCRPSLRTEDGKRVLIEDVAHFCRGPNPYNRLFTVTVCNGMFGRGTYGAVRTLTDARFRDRNARHIRSRFSDGRTFSILSRVKVAEGKVVTPDWTDPDQILHEWPDGRHG